MIACLDVAYSGASAYAAGLTFREWTDANALEERRVPLSNVQQYEPGQFFRRELPCLFAVLKVLPTANVILIDGYVWLGDGNKPGLGAHLYKSLSERTPVIGVAKTKFKGADSVAEVLRGRSTRPLFITGGESGMRRHAYPLDAGPLPNTDTTQARGQLMSQYANRLKWYNTEAVELTVKMRPGPARVSRLGR
jgi:deoxyribonuclease V